MKKQYETLWEKIFNRLPEKQANDAIRILRAGGTIHDIDTFDVRLLADQLTDTKKQLQAALRAYRRHQGRAAIKTFINVFFDREGAMLRQHAVNLASLYTDMRRDYRELQDLLNQAIANDKGAPKIEIGGSHD